MNCGDCLIASVNTGKKPLCHSKSCDASEFMHPELSTWIGMYSMLKSDLFSRSTMQILRRAKATERDFDIFLELDNVLNRHKIDKIAARNRE